MSGSGGGPARPGPGTNLQTACQTCPATGPCDCAKLAVRATKQATPPKVRELSTTRKLRGSRLTPALRSSGRATQEFEQFDLIIECVAGFLDRMDPPRPEDCVTLRAETEWDPACSNGRPHEIVLRPLGHVEQGMPAGVRDRVAVQSPEPVHLDWQPLDQIGGNNPLGALLGAFAMLVGDRVGTKKFEVHARSCGVRPGGASPNGSLTALFVLYRKAKIELSITLPPARESLRVRGTAAVGLGQEPRDATYGLRVANQRYLPGLGRVGDAQLAERPLGRTELGRLWSNEEIRQAPRDARDRDPATTIGQETKVQIKVNGRELDASAWVRRILGVKERVESVLDMFMELIHKAPQVGWRLEYTYQLLTGSLAAEYERTESDRPIDGRLLPAPMQLSLRADLVLLKLQGVLSFGFRFEGSWGVALARVEGSIGGEVKTSANLNIPGGERKWTATGTIPIEARATGELTVRETRVASAQLAVASGFELECTIFDDSPPPPNAARASADPWKLEWKLKLKKGVLTARVESQVASFIRWNVTREIWGDQRLWPGQGAP